MKYRVKIILIIFLATAFISSIKVSVVSKNFLNIKIKTNIDEIEFKQIIKNNNALYCNQTLGKYNITIPVKEFIAPNKMIYDDFVEMLKGNEYPNISIYISKSILNFDTNRDTVIYPEMTINLAGVSKVDKTLCHVKKISSDSCYIYGEKKLLFTDFNLLPPTKLFGLVKVSNDINVKFGFIFVKN
ncbi:MAG: hypothetical protein A2X12_01490 [Bacteroidetes bacterium GWE2_29_8]|nr:MAG: hypothetical protein A2X12_01490 [Bacteroidetes bacterium GWE2_29_8]OFY23379.1 MAG: hypothetical protein A2X02_08745 [Bacteroidetes bacterium GWF2_29_10]